MSGFRNVAVAAVVAVVAADPADCDDEGVESASHPPH